MLLLTISSATGSDLLVPAEFLNFYFSEENDWTLFIAELAPQKAYLAQFSKNPLQYTIIREFEISSGKQKGAKRSEWDLRTPFGYYQITQFRNQQTLQEKFGTGAFILNYPNLLDKALKKSGSGIWIHGTDKIEFIDYDSEGCIRMKNNDIVFLKNYLRPGETPVIITDKLNRKTISELLKLKSDWEDRYYSWIRAQNYEDLDSFLSFYHPAFHAPHVNMDFSRWSLYHKENGLNEYTDMKIQHFIYQDESILVLEIEKKELDSKETASIRETLWKLHNGNWFITRENSSSN